jgi:hypothetical protein
MLKLSDERVISHGILTLLLLLLFKLNTIHTYTNKYNNKSLISMLGLYKYDRDVNNNIALKLTKKKIK